MGSWPRGMFNGGEDRRLIAKEVSNVPIYEYRCKDCGSVTEILEGVGGTSKRPRCGSCGSTDVAKMFSSFAPVIAGGGAGERSCCGLTNPCDNPKRCCTK